jgi:DUF1365 family protein
MDDKTPKSNLPSPERSAALWNPEIDTYYDFVDETQGTIEFRKDHPTYKTLKSSLMGIGVDVDTIKTEDELITIETRHIVHINDFVQARLFNRKNPSLEGQLLKATITGDYKESARIRALLQKRNQIGLQIVKK